MAGKMEDAVMATVPNWYFVIENCPGPFKIMMGVGHMLEAHNNHLDFNFAVKPIEMGVKVLGHDRKFTIGFRAELIGATTKWGHGVDEPRNVRLLGSFLISSGLQGVGGGYKYLTPEVCAELAEFQWEVVFNPNGRHCGFVSKLKEPLHRDLTM